MPFFALPRKIRDKIYRESLCPTERTPRGVQKATEVVRLLGAVRGRDRYRVLGDSGDAYRYHMCVEAVTIRIPRDLSRKSDESKESIPALAHQYFWFCRGC
jgi:hypothetical protein